MNLNIIQMGGPVMWLLLVASVASGLAWLDKMFHLHRAQIKTQDFLDGIYNVLRRGNAVEAVTLCEDAPGPVAHVVRAGILKADEDPAEIARALQAAGLQEIPRLEKNLVVLATFAKLTPMIGLLGTILGMITTLGVLQAAGQSAHSTQLADGLRQALISSAAGLTIAIPCYAGYNFLVSRVEDIVLDMELASSEILAFLTRLQKERRSPDVSS